MEIVKKTKVNLHSLSIDINVKLQGFSLQYIRHEHITQ